MEGITLIIAIVALAIGIIAFQRTGGIKELRQEVDNLNIRTETVRERTANVLNRFEKMLRGSGDKKEPTREDRGNEPDSLNKPE